MEENSIINNDQQTVVSTIIERAVINTDDIAKDSLDIAGADLQSSVASQDVVLEKDGDKDVLDNPSEDSLITEIVERISALVSTDQYKALKIIIKKNSSLLTDNQDRMESVKRSIQYANKYVKELSERFLKVLLDTDWFEKYYDAVCLFNKAHESKEALEWCEALKNTLDVSISNPESSKIRALLNKQIVNAIFTLSVKTPYLRVGEGVFTELTPFVNIQSRAFYGWLKNIEALSLRLRDLWVEIEFRTINLEPFINNNEFLQSIEKADLSVMDSANEFVANLLQSYDIEYLFTIKRELDFFENHIADVIGHYEKLYEENDRTIKYLTDSLLNDYYKKDLESIFGIYDAIQLSIDSLLSKHNISDETDKWSALLKSLSVTIIHFMSKQGIYKCPELIVGKTHIDNDIFRINNQDVGFFTFAKITSATEAPSEELKDRVASIRNYGFYMLDSENRIRILRETKVSVYN